MAVACLRTSRIGSWNQDKWPIAISSLHQAFKPHNCTSSSSHPSISFTFVNMATIISEIVKITINPAVFKLSSPAFASLRKASVQFGVKEQYYGINTEDKSELFWIIRRFSLLLHFAFCIVHILIQRLATNYRMAQNHWRQSVWCIQEVGQRTRRKRCPCIMVHSVWRCKCGPP